MKIIVCNIGIDGSKVLHLLLQKLYGFDALVCLKINGDIPDIPESNHPEIAFMYTTGEISPELFKKIRTKFPHAEPVFIFGSQKEMLHLSFEKDRVAVPKDLCQYQMNNNPEGALKFLEKNLNLAPVFAQREKVP